MLDMESVVEEFVETSKSDSEGDFDYLIELVTDKILNNFGDQPIELGEAFTTAGVVLNRPLKKAN